MTNSLGPMAAALEAALETAPTLPRDAAAVKLLREYARLLDNAAPAAKYRKALDTLAMQMGEMPERVVEAFRVVVTALGEHSVASDLGPKFLTTLTSLGMTAAGRGLKGGTHDPGPAPANPLAGLRDEIADQRTRRGAAG